MTGLLHRWMDRDCNGRYTRWVQRLHVRLFHRDSA